MGNNEAYREWAESLFGLAGAKEEGVWSTYYGFPAYYGDLKIEEGIPRLFVPTHEFVKLLDNFRRKRLLNMRLTDANVPNKPYWVTINYAEKRGGVTHHKQEFVTYDTMTARLAETPDSPVWVLFIRSDWFTVIKRELNDPMVTGNLVEKVDPYAYMGEAWG